MMQRSIVLGVGVLSLLTTATCSAAMLTIDATDRGFYFAYTTPHHTPDVTAYLARVSSPGDPSRNFFVFDLSGVSEDILSAELRLYNPGVDADGHDGYDNTVPQATYSVYDVTTPISNLLAPDFHEGDETYNDLGSGVLFGSQIVSPDDNGKYVTVALNEQFIAAANAEDNLIAIGGDISDGWIFGYTGSEVPLSSTQLVLTVVPEPSTIVLLGICGAIAALARPRRGHY